MFGVYYHYTCIQVKLMKRLLYICLLHQLQISMVDDISRDIEIVAEQVVGMRK